MSEHLVVNVNDVLEVIRAECKETSRSPAASRLVWTGPSGPSAGDIKNPSADDGRAALFEERREALFLAASVAQSHVADLDDSLAQLLRFNLDGAGRTVDNIAAEAANMLSRLQKSPPPLERPPDSLPAAYFAVERHWDCVRVVTCMPQTLIRLAVSGATSSYANALVRDCSDLLNGVGALMESVCAKERALARVNQPAGYLEFIVRAFLWNIWHRTRTLQGYFVLRRNLSKGYSYDAETFGWVRHFSVRPDTSLTAFCADSAWRDKPDNMCTWVFTLVQNDSACLGLDFRRLHELYNIAFGSIDARCRIGSTKPCDGDGPNCLRYKGASIAEQSVHDSSCAYKNATEPRLTWDEDSYRAISGPRAVTIAGPTSQDLQYCSAGKRTLAISHVWSHGQGGRPEVGINHCLHRRYCQIAKHLGCDSYWMDTVAIPEDHDLRREAIAQINTVFRDSHAVLVCDRDLMTVDVSKQTTELFEALIIAVLLCDWNVRAWTILEGMKGRETIHLLCKDNQTINLREVLVKVLGDGRLDAIVFANLFPHLLPSHTNQPGAQGRPLDAPLELAGTWLSYRPASRKDDEIVIWSLLLADASPPLHNAMDFWKAQKTVCTGYLVSGNPRLTLPGLTWAPSSPYTMVQNLATQDPLSRIHRPMPRSDTWLGAIHEDGLWAPWYLYEYGSRFEGLTKKLGNHGIGIQILGLPHSTDAELERIRVCFKIRAQWVALLQPVPWTEVFTPDAVSHKVADATQSDPYSRVFVVCASDKSEIKRCGDKEIFPEWVKSYRWVWKGVYEWPKDVPLPVLKINPRVWIG